MSTRIPTLFAAAALLLGCTSTPGEGSETHFACNRDADCDKYGADLICVKSQCVAASDGGGAGGASDGGASSSGGASGATGSGGGSGGVPDAGSGDPDTGTGAPDAGGRSTDAGFVPSVGFSFTAVAGTPMY